MRRTTTKRGTPKTGRPPEPLLTVAEVSDRFAVSERTVRRWIEEGRLRALRLGRAVRIEEADLEDFLAAARGRER